MAILPGLGSIIAIVVLVVAVVMAVVGTLPVVEAALISGLAVARLT